MFNFFRFDRTTVIVPIFGGLGNQLFQYAYALSQLENPQCRVILVDSAQRIKVFRRFELKGLVKTSSNRLIVIRFHLASLLLGKLVHKYMSLPNNKKESFEKLGIFHEYSDPQAESRIVIGNFQDSLIVQGISEKLIQNYSEYLNIYDRTSFKQRNYRYLVIHLRRGDYKNDVHGYLSYSYYASILEQLNASSCKIIVHTDDIPIAEAMRAFIDISEIIGPNEADPWDVITDMTGAEFVICANSTLSWWGGWFCIQSGGKAFIPSPWFKALDSGTYLEYPGFFIVPSIWE